MAAWIGGEFGGEKIHVHVLLKPFTVAPETITILLVGYIPLGNKKFKKKDSKLA